MFCGVFREGENIHVINAYVGRYKVISNKNVNTMIKKLKDFEIRKNSRWAIYGTGNGAERVYAALCSLSLNPAVKNVLSITQYSNLSPLIINSLRVFKTPVS